MSDTQKTETSPGAQEEQASSAMESSSLERTPNSQNAADLAKNEPDGKAPSSASFAEQDASESKTIDSPSGKAAWEEAQKAPSKSDQDFVSKWAKVFDGCAKIGPLYLLIFICLMVWPDYWQKNPGVFCPPEIKSVTAYLHCIQNASWLTPMALDHGVWALPQWPLFYMFLGLLALIPGLAEANWLIPLACASSALIAIWGAYFFTHAAGFGSKAAFATGLILLCAPIFAPLHHFFGPITLATGLMLFSLAFFCRGWRSHASWLSLPLAFIFAALAGLSGGVLYIAIPFVGSLCYLIWQGKYRRGQSWDALAGFLLMLIIIGLWLGAVSLSDHPKDYLPTLFADSISFSWPPQTFWFLALLAGAIGTLPWLLCIFGVSWFRVLKDSIKSFAASRHDNGSALMWLSLILAVCLSLFVPHSPIAAITIAALLAPLLGKAFVRLSPGGNRFFFFLASLFLILIGCVLLAVHFEQSQRFIFEMLPIQPPAVVANELLKLDAIIWISAVCILAGLGGFFFVKRARGGGGMIYASLITVIIGQIALFMVSPALQNNPSLPLKNLNIIAQEVEAAKLAPAIPAETPASPAPEQPTLSAPEAPTSPEGALPVEPKTEENLPNLTVPNSSDTSQSSSTEPAAESPGATIPSAPEVPATEGNKPVPEGLPDGIVPAPENPAAGVPMILPDAVAVPQAGAQEVIIIEESVNPTSPAENPANPAADKQ